LKPNQITDYINLFQVVFLHQAIILGDGPVHGVHASLSRSSSPGDPVNHARLLGFLASDTAPIADHVSESDQ
jgi:hypothetical protein